MCNFPSGIASQFGFSPGLNNNRSLYLFKFVLLLFINDQIYPATNNAKQIVDKILLYNLFLKTLDDLDDGGGLGGTAKVVVCSYTRHRAFINLVRYNASFSFLSRYI